MEDNEKTPRPTKMQRQTRRARSTNTTSFLPPSDSISSHSTEDNGTVESHHSGRVSPTKQMAILQDAPEPVLFYDFGWPDVSLAKDVEIMRDGVQSLADHRGILGHTVRGNPRHMLPGR